MDNKVHPQWETIQKLYQSKFGTAPEVIDFIAVKDVLRLCCYGFTPQGIAVDLHMDESYVVSILEDYYGFSGWTNDLQADLYSIYRSIESFEDFENYLINFSAPIVYTRLKAVGDIRFAYNMCETYEKLQELLEDYE